jgi:hypothetical protein
VAKERALRRAQREAAAAARAEQRALQAGRAEQRERRKARLRPGFARRRPRGDSLLQRRRRSQNRAFAGALLAVQVLGWLIAQSAAISIALLVFSVFTAPVAHRMLFDRRG